MQTKDKQLAQVPAEQLAQQVAKALQTEEGQKQLQPLFQQFQSEMQGEMFKCGGKMDQAVKRMQPGESAEIVKAPRREIQNDEDPRLRDEWREIIGDYQYIDGEWYDMYNNPYRPVGDDLHHDLYNASYKSPSNRRLNQRRNFYARQQTVVDEDGNTAYTLTTGYPKQNYHALKEGRTMDSVITRKHGFNRGEEASNKDFGVKFYRNFPKVSEFFGFVPDYEQ
jgi:hypothetical protein